MASYRVMMSPRAKARLQDICRYLNEELYIPKSSDKLLDDLEAKFAILSDFPLAYAIDEEASEVIGQEVRSVRIRAFKLLYWVDTRNSAVLVFSIRFGSENPATLQKSDFDPFPL